MRVTTKQHILEYLGRGGWIPLWELERQGEFWGNNGSTISRRCRELVAEDKLIRILNNKGAVMYKLATPKVFLGEVAEDIQQERLFEPEQKMEA